MRLVASLAGTAPACSADGMLSTAPDLRRLTLPPMKAPGLLRSKATNIWSREMPEGLFCAAILPAVSPGLTATSWPVDTGVIDLALAAGCRACGFVTAAGLAGAWATGGGEGT